MEKISGIQFEQDIIGRNTYVRIDLKKHGEKIKPFLKEIGVTDDDFELDWQRGLTVKEAKQEMQKRIDAWPDK
jgi:hypothetical protein